MAEVIRAENLIKDYVNKEIITRVIDGITLTVNEGEFLSICGASGSGKSTLLYLLSGLERVTSGVVILNGHNLNNLTEKELSKIRRKEISFVYQYYNLIPNLTVKENILLPLILDRKAVQKDYEKLSELTEVAGISHILARRPDEISGGEQQRTALVRALIVSPKIIFLDEPTGNLDSISSEKVINLVKNINKDYNTTIVMVTHSKEQAEIADRIITLSDGKITA